ncbi:ATP-binding protein [Lentzea guizhouensis]|uniref:ATP-binding protein n=1 Tax=Lentzea guizhouensis TaxID=1586287 RepID=UPI000AF5AAEE
MPALIGRTDEIRCLDGLLAAARDGSGGVLVLRGEAGIGKSALLGHVREAAGFRLVEASGAEFETDLPFAALHQLCLPVLGHLAELEPQRRNAIEVAFGMAEGAPDLFRIGLAALDLLAAAARDQPLLCVVDDAHWLDTASAKALSFLARRIAAEPVAMVFAAREGLTELPSLEITGLSDADARTVLAGVADERVLAEARGNPLALKELSKGGFGLPDSTSVVHRVERGFQSRLDGLSGRQLVILASADATGDPGLLWAAAEVLGLSADVDTGDLVTFSTKVRFCHPLARSAVYRSASAAERRAAHRALAQVTTDPDRRRGTGPRRRQGPTTRSPPNWRPLPDGPVRGRAAGVGGVPRTGGGVVAGPGGAHGTHAARPRPSSTRVRPRRRPSCWPRWSRRTTCSTPARTCCAAGSRSCARRTVPRSCSAPRTGWPRSTRGGPATASSTPWRWDWW